VAIERLKLSVFRIIPGNRGKVRSGWLIWLLRNRIERFGGEAGFTGSSDTFARVSTAKDGTVRQGAIRNRSESSQVVQASFEPGRIAVAKRYWLLL